MSVGTKKERKKKDNEKEGNEKIRADTYREKRKYYTI
jgi:hypothetical protein